MKKHCLKLFIVLLCLATSSQAQNINPKQDIFPKGTTFINNVPYANDTLKKHLLDIYLPPVAKSTYPLIVWIHGGGWKMNDKYSDMSYMTQTLKGFMDKGYAVGSINYRYSTDIPFPGQIQDCNQAVEFLYQNAAKYKLDKERIALIGFSAGGHLASLMGLSNNNTVRQFYHDGKKPQFKIKLVLDFYGPSNFQALTGDDLKDPKSPVSLLLGGILSERSAQAKLASPVTYIDKNAPPFLIVQGEKDQSVNPDQSISLSEKLKKAGVKNDLI